MKHEKILLAKLKKAGCTFEISVDSEMALEFKEGLIDDISQVLQSEHIFSDAKKGELAPSDQLQKVFNTTNVGNIAAQILQTGEIQLTSKHRKEEREAAQAKMVEMIHKLVLNPLTNTPHPRMRIESALTLAKITVSEHTPIENQLQECIRKLRPHLPLKIEMKILHISVKAQYIGRIGNYIRKNSKILKEEWDLKGNWNTNIEVAAGFELDLIDRLNTLTRGDIIIQNDKK
jgi:ribosome maturation protein SDO1